MHEDRKDVKDRISQNTNERRDKHSWDHQEFALLLNGSTPSPLKALAIDFADEISLHRTWSEIWWKTTNEGIEGERFSVSQEDWILRSRI